ncbi:MAG: hypothetical protein MR319_02125, partial [Mediterranea sp.]|nr:hypothetical protein [Mediterranea sp.]
NLFDRAMTAYTGALRTAERNLLDDKAGYINSYMGDLYSEDRRTKFFLSLSRIGEEEECLGCFRGERQEFVGNKEIYY